jgi:transcriptional regulator GlxA family with amidase domain
VLLQLLHPNGIHRSPRRGFGTCPAPGTAIFLSTREKTPGEGYSTSAGITAGMDLAIALVEEDHGHQVALQIARISVMFLVRPGGQSQYSHMLSRQAATSQPLRELQVWMIENLREDLGVERLAKRMGMSARNFTRVCLRETRMNPGQFVDRMRVEAAQRMIDSFAMCLKEIADACGFQTPLAMRRTFLRVLGITAGEYASRFKRSQSQTKMHR